MIDEESENCLPISLEIGGANRKWHFQIMRLGFSSAIASGWG
jgi:hypothetical protein